MICALLADIYFMNALIPFIGIEVVKNESK